MAEARHMFSYVAMDDAGRRLKGLVSAGSDGAAFEQLRRDGLSPLSIRPAKAAGGAVRATGRKLSDRDLGALLFDLAALLKAGADMRAALALLATRSKDAEVKALCRKFNTEISGGGALDEAFARHLRRSQEFVTALVAAGEAAGDLSAGFQRAADLLESRIKLRDQLVSTLSYPAFILVSTLAAMMVILLFVVPSLAPLVGQEGAAPPAALGALIAVSDFLRGNLATIGVALAAAVAAAVLAGRAGLLSRYLDRLLLDGPARETAAGFIFGGFAISLGNMLTAGAPISDALRLAVRAVGSSAARDRLTPVISAVRDGQSLSAALDGVPRFPVSISRLAAVGEISGGLGPMLARAGKLEEDAAVRRLEAVVRVAGPAIIVALGGLIGLLMASLLSGVSQIGQSALQ